MIHFKDNKNKSALSTRWAQMTKQEQIIERKKMEIQAKLEAQKQAAALAAQAKLSNPTTTDDSKGTPNIFSNDGSFMSNFKALLEKQQQDKKDKEDKEKAKLAEENKKKKKEQQKSNKLQEDTNTPDDQSGQQENSNSSNEDKKKQNDRGSRDRHRRWSDNRRNRTRSPVTPVIENRNKIDDSNKIMPLMELSVMPPEEQNSDSESQWNAPQGQDSKDESDYSDQGNVMGPGPMGINMMGPGGRGVGPMGQGPMGSGPMGPGGPMGHGPIGLGPVGPGMMGPGSIGPGPGPMGPGHMGPGPMGPGQMGPGSMGSGPMGSGPMGPGPMGHGPMGSGPMGHGPMGSGPMGHGPMGPGPMGPGPMGHGGPGHMGPGGPMMGPGGPGGPMPPFMGGPPNFPMRPNFMGPNGPGGPGPMPPNMCGPNMRGPGPNGPMPPFFGPPFSNPAMMGQNGPPNSMMGPNGGPFMGPRPPFGPNMHNFGPNSNGSPKIPPFGPNSMGSKSMRPNSDTKENVALPPAEPTKQNIAPPPLPHMPKTKDFDHGNVPPPPPPKPGQVLSADMFPPAIQRAASEVATNGDQWENVLKAIHSQDQNMWFLHNTNSSEYKAFRELVAKIRLKQNPDMKPEVKPEDKYEPEFSLEDDDSDDSRPTVKRESDNSNPSMQFPYNQYMNSVKREQASSQSDEESDNKRARRKRKSRWGDDPPAEDVKPPGLISFPPELSGQMPLGAGPKLSKIDEEGLKLTNVNRNNQALMQYALTNYGTTNLNAEDWKKCEDNFKLNLLYQDMLKKRQQVERLAAAGKHKYEYDSDEDTAEGTWEHKLRAKEMFATEKWATELTKQAAGKHHIGDFLPPEELKKFMEKYSAFKSGKEPDLSDYKEFKLKEDNLGFKMLQKLGWNEGQGLGVEGTGIVDPVNKAQQPVSNMGLGAAADGVCPEDDEFDAYRKRMMLAYRFRPNPLNNPRRPYY